MPMCSAFPLAFAVAGYVSSHISSRMMDVMEPGSRGAEKQSRLDHQEMKEPT